MILLPDEGVATAAKVAVGFEQVIVPEELQVTVGADAFDKRVVLAEAVQPFPDWVTVTV